MARKLVARSQDEISNNYDLDLIEGVEDDAENAPTGPVRFNISFYGADYPVESIIQRMDRADFFVPEFQRSYVWSYRQASRFIESLLYGLPVPGIFLYREPVTNRHLIIDGQQRLKTLQLFHAGNFGEKRFRLLDVAVPWNGRTFNELAEADRRRLLDAVIHATVFKQEEPVENDQSIYYVFERINTGGMLLSGQEIRTCVYYGPFVALLRELNADSNWRRAYGPISRRLKDQELILRFLAFFHKSKDYARPMSAFLNNFMGEHRSLNRGQAAKFGGLFKKSIAAVIALLGENPFRPERAFNAAVFDSVMVGLTTRLERGPIKAASNQVSAQYRALLADKQYDRAYRRSTADEESVATRIRLAIEAFAQIKQCSSRWKGALVS